MSFYLAPIFTLPFTEGFAGGFAPSQSVQDVASSTSLSIPLLSIRWVADTSAYSWLGEQAFTTDVATTLLPLDRVGKGIALSLGASASPSAFLGVPDVSEASAIAENRSSNWQTPGIEAALSTEIATALSAALSTEIATHNKALFPQRDPSALSALSLQPVLSTTAQSTVTQSTVVDPSNALMTADAVITQGSDGNWTLSYPVQNAPQAQAVIATLARSAVRSQQDCADSICKGLEYIESQLPGVKTEIQQLQAQIATFEQSQTNGDTAAYQVVLADRQAEIAQQKNALMLSHYATEQSLITLKQQLVEIGAQGDEVDFAEQILAQDADYQAAWSRLQQSEQSLTQAFSSAEADTTALYEIYSDYEFHQAALYRLANEAVVRYFVQESAAVPGLMQTTPATLAWVQQLATVAGEHQMEQLRLETIAQIEEKLKARSQQLINSIGDYEQWQQQLATAQQLLAQYEQEQANLQAQRQAQRQTQRQAQRQDKLAVSSQTAQASPVEAQQNKTRQNQRRSAFDRAKQLVPYLPEGSTAQAVLYLVLASAAVAKITARRRAPQRVIIPQLAVAEFKPLATIDATRATIGATIEATVQQLADVLLPQPSFSTVAVSSGLSSGLSSAIPSNSYLAPSFSTRTLFSAVAPSSLIAPAPVVWTAPITASRTAAQLDAELASLLGETQPDNSQQPAVQTADNSFEARILAELIELTGQSTRIVKASSGDTSAVSTNSSSSSSSAAADADAIAIEIMTRELQEIVDQATPEGSLANEIQSRAVESVHLPLDEVDAFVERAIDWVIKDLGLSPMAAELDAAESAVKAAVKSPVADHNDGRTVRTARSPIADRSPDTAGTVSVRSEHPRSLAEAAAT